MKLNTLKKRSATFVFRASSPSANINGLVTALNNISSDLGDLYNEWNNKLKPAIDALPKGTDDEIVGLSESIDAIKNGLDGANMFVDRDADEDSPEWLYSTILDRQLTIKESITEVYESLKAQIDAITIDDDSGISQYTIDYVGAKAFDSNDSSSATSMDGRIGTLEAWVDAADYVETADLDAVKTYVGMSGTETAPVFSDHTGGDPLNKITDGISLEKAIALIDQGLYLPDDYGAKQILFGDGDQYPATSSTFVWDNVQGFLGIGTATPVVALHVEGIIGHTKGVVSLGGNFRGVGATDLQATRLAATQVASGNYSSVLGGQNNTASAIAATAFGDTCVAAASYSVASGRESATNWSGEAASANGMFATPGDNGYSRLHYRISTTGAGPDEMFLDGASLVPILSDNTTYAVEIHVVGRDSTNEHCYYILNFLIRRNSGAASTALVGSVNKTVVAESTASLDANVGADTILGSFDLTVTGLALTNMRWAATAHITKVSV